MKHTFKATGFSTIEGLPVLECMNCSMRTANPIDTPCLATPRNKAIRFNRLRYVTSIFRLHRPTDLHEKSTQIVNALIPVFDELIDTVGLDQAERLINNAKQISIQKLKNP